MNKDELMGNFQQMLLDKLRDGILNFHLTHHGVIHHCGLSTKEIVEGAVKRLLADHTDSCPNTPCSS